MNDTLLGGIFLILLVVILIVCLTKREHFTDISDSDSPIPTPSQKLLEQSLYSPIICRPPDNVHVEQSKDCPWPCYAKSRFQVPCDEDTEIDYYAMRPLLTCDQYTGLLGQIFKTIGDHAKGPQLSGNQTEISKESQIFCNSPYTQKDLSKFVVEEIQKEANKVPALNKNSGWKTEYFSYTDPQIYSFKDGANTFYRIILNLFNPLRSASTMIYAEVLETDSNKSLRFVDFVTNLREVSPVSGYDIGRPGKPPGIEVNDTIPNSPLAKTNDIPGSDISTPDSFSFGDKGVLWNLGSHVPEIRFNQNGFYEPGKNIQVEGGVPASLSEKLKRCEESYLLECMEYKLDKDGNVPQVKEPGVTTPDLQFVNNFPGSMVARVQ